MNGTFRVHILLSNACPASPALWVGRFPLPDRIKRKTQWFTPVNSFNRKPTVFLSFFTFLWVNQILFFVNLNKKAHSLPVGHILRIGPERKSSFLPVSKGATLE